MHLKGGAKDRAAAMFEKSGDPRRAAELYYQAGDMNAAAAALAGAGDHLGAARLALRAGDKKRAAQELAMVPPTEPTYMTALSELADILSELGRRDLAIQRLVAAIPRDRKIVDPAQGEITYKLAVMLAAAGRTSEAKLAFDMLRVWNPGFKDVAARMAALPAEDPQSKIPPATTLRHIPTAPTGTGPISNKDPFAALDTTMPAIDTGVVTRMAGYELLKTLPIFEDLSLDEMKDFYNLCEQVAFEPGEVLIEQGRPGQALYIVRSGSLHVVAVEPSGHERPLTTLPAGIYVGEMSLIDESPTRPA